jgi:hypothetical protein
MAIGDPFPGAGITNIIGQQGNPMGGVVESRSSNMFNPNETPEDAVLRLWQANAGIDQIAQLTGIPSPQIAHIINNYTGADTRMNNQFIQPLPAGAGVETEFEEEAVTELPFGQVDTEQITTRPDLISDGLGTQALMAMDSSLTENSPEVGEARNLEQKIIKTGTDVYGLNTEDPDVIQTGNVLSLDVLDGLQDDEEGISDDVKNQVLQDIGLNDVFTNENISMEDRIDFFKHYMAETLGLNYDDLKKSSDEGMPFMMAGAAMLQASKDGESRMAGLGKALISFGTTKSQLARIADKEAAAYMMKAFDLGLESHKIAKAGSAGSTATDWVNIGGVPYLLPKTDIMALGQALPGSVKPWKETDAKREMYNVPKLLKNGLIGFEKRYMTEAELKTADNALDSDLKDKGYKILPLQGGTGAAAKTILHSPADSDLFFPMQMDQYLALPPDEQGEIRDPTQMVQVFDMENQIGGWADKKELDPNYSGFQTYTDENGIEQPKFVPPSTAEYWEVGPDGIMTFIKGQRGKDIGGFLTSRELSRRVGKDTEELRNIDKNTVKALSLLDRARGYAEPGVFGPVGELAANVGGFIGSFGEFTSAWQKELPKGVDRSDYTKLKDNFIAENWNEVQHYGWVGELRAKNVSKEQIMGTLFSLALASAQLLNDQKGRDISNYDLQRFMQRVGANAGTVVGFTALINDLEEDILNNIENTFEKAKQYQLQVPNEEGETTGHLSGIGGIFAPGGSYEKTLADITKRRELLNERKAKLGQEFGLETEDRGGRPPVDYSKFRLNIRQDQTGKATRREVNKKTNSPITWERIASDIFYQAYDLNRNDTEKAKLIEIIINENFNEGDPERDEFIAWYGTLLQ